MRLRETLSRQLGYDSRVSGISRGEAGRLDEAVQPFGLVRAVTPGEITADLGRQLRRALLHDSWLIAERHYPGAPSLQALHNGEVPMAGAPTVVSAGGSVANAAVAPPAR